MFCVKVREGGEDKKENKETKRQKVNGIEEEFHLLIRRRDGRRKEKDRQNQKSPPLFNRRSEGNKMAPTQYRDGL